MGVRRCLTWASNRRPRAGWRRWWSRPCWSRPGTWRPPRSRPPTRTDPEGAAGQGRRRTKHAQRSRQISYNAKINREMVSVLCWNEWWLVVFYVPSTARSFRDGTPIYCLLRRTWSSVFTPFPQGIEPRAVAWQSITQPLRHAETKEVPMQYVCLCLYSDVPVPQLTGNRRCVGNLWHGYIRI